MDCLIRRLIQSINRGLLLNGGPPPINSRYLSIVPLNPSWNCPYSAFARYLVRAWRSEPLALTLRATSLGWGRQYKEILEWGVEKRIGVGFCGKVIWRLFSNSMWIWLWSEGLELSYAESLDYMQDVIGKCQSDPRVMIVNPTGSFPRRDEHEEFCIREGCIDSQGMSELTRDVFTKKGFLHSRWMSELMKDVWTREGCVHQERISALTKDVFTKKGFLYSRRMYSLRKDLRTHEGCVH